MSLAVKTSHLCKSYGDHQVLTDVNLAVPEGAIYGFVGANGAGKTTTIRILLGLAAATKGDATVLGTTRGKLPPTPIPGVSYLPDVPNISPWLGAHDALMFLAQVGDINPDLVSDRADELLDFVGLRHAPGKIGTFSRGMKQRLGIAAALVTAPKLLVLDEPTSALDPIGRADVLAIIKQLTGQATVMFSTHILKDVQKVSTHLGVLKHGHLIAQGSLDELLNADNSSRARLMVKTRPELSEKITEAIYALDPSAQIDPQPRDLEELFNTLNTNEQEGHDHD